MPHIRCKVIVSVYNRGDVLLSSGYDPVRDFRYYIPVGGGVEFGERLIDAASRELAEEIGLCDVPLDFIGFHESHFVFAGVPEHEIMLHYACHINDEARAGLPAQGVESNGDLFDLHWLSADALEDVCDGVVPPTAYDELQSGIAKNLLEFAPEG